MVGWYGDRRRAHLAGGVRRDAAVEAAGRPAARRRVGGAGGVARRRAATRADLAAAAVGVGRTRGGATGGCLRLGRRAAAGRSAAVGTAAGMSVAPRAPPRRSRGAA